MMTQYKNIVIKTCIARCERRGERVRANPWPGQGVPETAFVECSRPMRDEYPVGTNFKIKAKITDREGGTPFIYTHYSWPWGVLSDEEAKEFIKQNF